MCYSVVVSRYILYTLFTLWLTCEGDITLNLEFSFWKLPFLIVSTFKGVNFQKRLFTPLGGILGPFSYDQWGMKQNHAGRRKNNRLDDPNLLLISVGHEVESCRPQYNNKIMGLTHLSTYRYFNDLVMRTVCESARYRLKQSIQA